MHQLDHRTRRERLPAIGLALAILACSLPGTPTQPPPAPTAAALPEETSLPAETPMTEPTPIHTSSGLDYALGAGLCFDLDSGLEVGCNALEADFRFLAEETATTAEWAIVPLGSTEMRSLGAGYESVDPPTEAMCSTHALLPDPLDLLPMAEVFWNCYRTGEGLVGWLKAHTWTSGTLSFSWATFSAP
jgi:hypothetical protein